MKPQDRIRQVNRLADRIPGENANAHYIQAKAAYRSFTEMWLDLSPEQAEPLQQIEEHLHKLWIADAWSAEEKAALDSWLAANKDTLQGVEGATSLPRYFRPLPDDGGRLHAAAFSGGPSPPMTLSQLVLVQANALAVDGNWPEAYAWNLRLLRMAHHEYQRPFVLHRMMGGFVERRACEQLFAFLRRNFPENPDRLVEALQSVDRFRCPDDVAEEVERLWATDYIEAWHEWAVDPTANTGLEATIAVLFDRDDGFDYSALGMDKPPYESADELRAALRASSVARELAVAADMNTLWSAWNAQPFHLAWKEVTDFERRYCDTTKKAPSLAAGGCSSFASSRATVMRRLTELERTAVLCVIALQRHQKANGRFPRRLTQLVPTYLDETPLDLFSGKPLAYKRTNKGRDFLLYSIGSDQIDDGGKHTDDWSKAGDLVYWPPPATNED